MKIDDRTPVSSRLLHHRLFRLERFWLVMVGAVWLTAFLNLTLRDKWEIWATVFYATPDFLLGCAALLLVWIGRGEKCSRIVRRLTLLLSLVLVAVGMNRDLQWMMNSDDDLPSRESFQRIVFWNVGRGWFADWNQIADELHRFDADVIALAEATDDEVQTREFWTERLPEFEPLPLRGGLVVLVRGTANQRAAGMLAGAGRFRRVSIESRGQSFELILADITSDPRKSRWPPLSKLFEIMQAQSTTPTLVVGDFNTPPNSACFDVWRHGWSRAWETCGSGFQPTWPQPIPVLTLDHVWGNRGIDFHACHHGWSVCSDHRPVVTDITIRSFRQEGSP